VSGQRDSGSSDLAIDAVAANGASGQGHVTLRHSDNLAVNATGSPYPRVWASSYQYQHPPSFLTDGLASTYWVSAGQTPGQAPTPEAPEYIGVDLGHATKVRAVGLSGRDNWAPRSYDIQTSLDGKTWSTVRSVEDEAGGTASFTPTTARHVRLRITEASSPTSPGHNTQLSEFAVYSD
jgi:hypothetical protein